MCCELNQLGISLALLACIACDAESEVSVNLSIGHTITGVEYLDESEMFVFASTGSIGNLEFADSGSVITNWSIAGLTAPRLKASRGAVHIFDGERIIAANAVGQLLGSAEVPPLQNVVSVVDGTADLSVLATSRCNRALMQRIGKNGDTVTVVLKNDEGTFLEFTRETLPRFSVDDRWLLTVTTPVAGTADEIVIRDVGRHTISARYNIPTGATCSTACRSDSWVFVVGLNDGSVVACSSTAVKNCQVSNVPIASVAATRTNVYCVDRAGIVWRVGLLDAEAEKIGSATRIHPTSLAVSESLEKAIVGSWEGVLAVVDIGRCR
jgi:hypothetical protein